jgi:hypothetical protein
MKRSLLLSILLLLLTAANVNAQEPGKNRIGCNSVSNRLPVTDTGTIMMQGNIMEVKGNPDKEALIQFMQSKGLHPANGYYTVVFKADDCEELLFLPSANSLAIKLDKTDKVTLRCLVIKPNMKTFSYPVIIANDIIVHR